MHSALNLESIVGESQTIGVRRVHKTFEQGYIQRVLGSTRVRRTQVVVLDLWSKLQLISDENAVLDGRKQCSEIMRF